jgi:membrane-bound lytic murein transglycosylase D
LSSIVRNLVLAAAVISLGATSPASATPASPEQVADQIIAQAAYHYKEGVLAWRETKLDRARREWDAAIDTFLEGQVPVLQSEKLQLAYREMIETIAEYERGAEVAGLDLPDQLYEPTPDEFRQELAELPSLKQPDLAVALNPQVAAFVHYYSKGAGRATMRNGLTRSANYRPLAERIFAEEGVPTDLVWLAQVESGWRTTALSPAGALGVWQSMPATGVRFGLRQAGAVDERMDFVKATRAAARYLKVLNQRYRGDWHLAIAAYNCGEGNVDRAISRAGGVRDFWTLRRLGLLPHETSNYVPAVLATALIASNPDRFRFE